MEGQLVAFLASQSGSRFIQKKLEEMSSAEKDRLCELYFTEVKEKQTELMMDRYGNYIFQKLISKMDSNMRLKVLQLIPEDNPDARPLTEACQDSRGTHCV